MEVSHFILFIAALIFFYTLGFWAKNYAEKKNVNFDEGLGSVEGSVLALFAFFLGFTFNISASKIETVRQTSINESNAIGTALLRTELYTSSEIAQYKSLFKNYIKQRINYFEAGKNDDEINKALQEGLKQGENIWDYTVSLKNTGKFSEESRLMLPAVNEMIDAVSTRDSAIKSTLPNTIIFTLFALSLCSTFIVGFSMKKRILANFIGIIYIVTIALTVNLIIDASNPRSGFINTLKANHGMIELYDSLD